MAKRVPTGLLWLFHLAEMANRGIRACHAVGSVSEATFGWWSTMKSGFVPGVTREVTITVTEDMCPAFDGHVVHRCYSTWSCAHHFEIAARKVLVDFLEPHEEGVGSHVSVDHFAPCSVGKQVTIRAVLTEVTRDHHPRVVCELTAHDGDRLLARGRQVQVVMNKEHLRRYIDKS